MSKVAVQPPEIQLRIEELTPMHTALAKALGEAGMGGARLDETFSNSIHAVCIGCGLVITGEDLGHITVLPGVAPTVDNKLDRLRLGYCARKGCDSRFYRVTCAPLDEFDVAKVMNRADAIRRNSLEKPVHTRMEIASARLKGWWGDRKIRLGIGLALMVLLLITWWAWRHEAIPGFKPTPRFESLPTSTGEAL